MRILVIEDDISMVKALNILLSAYNYAVDSANDGKTGLEMIECFEYDLVLLDINLPQIDGISLCQLIRAKGYQMPILLLTGISNGETKALALNIGADDYVTKPFDSKELIARVHALLRRGKITTKPVLQWENLQLTPHSHQVTYNNQPLNLTAKEYAILELVLRNNQQVFTPDMILDHIWVGTKSPGTDVIRVHIKKIRQKLKAVGAPFDLIETVYGVGYRLKPFQP